MIDLTETWRMLGDVRSYECCLASRLVSMILMTLASRKLVVLTLCWENCRAVVSPVPLTEPHPQDWQALVAFEVFLEVYLR